MDNSGGLMIKINEISAIPNNEVFGCFYNFRWIFEEIIELKNQWFCRFIHRLRKMLASLDKNIIIGINSCIRNIS